MVHRDVKEVGRIPDGDGWRIHGRDSEQARCVSRDNVAAVRLVDELVTDRVSAKSRADRPALAELGRFSRGSA